MSEQTLPPDATPLSPLAYYQESLSVWNDICAKTWQLVTDQMDAMAVPDKQDQKETETPASVFICAISDINLRHWHNTSRLLENFPAWLRQPSLAASAGIIDWFDHTQNRQPAFGSIQQEQMPPAVPRQAVATIPVVPAPDTATAASRSGDYSDDLTLIQGIGPKRSKQLNALGINQFRQIADWSLLHAEQIDKKLACKGGVLREDWRGQARQLLKK